jgi:ATP-dependent helicase YprA (DUF1998 family)
MRSIKQVSEQLEADLEKYLEATYHLHHPRLLKERRALMEEGEISTEPWVEATPSYESGNKFRNLDLPSTVVDLLKQLEDDGLDIFDPPYKHQADALESFFAEDQDLIVSTGTGSGKTEIFLYSILGQLAEEAQRGVSNEDRGVRTLILYPMNALVADQLSRMRLLFGDPDGAATLEETFGRRPQFGMYTSRTPYHGEFDTDKNDRRVKPVIDRYRKLRKQQPELFDELLENGRIPAKDLDGFRNYGNAKEDAYRTQRGDSELFTRQEMHSPVSDYGGTPDLLITNYSMLEYMLLRPIEQPLFADTKDWLEADEDNELTIVLDEAHLYRGAQGAEVGLLLSRLMQKLGISRDRVRFILTSATMGDNIEEAAPEFAAQLTTGDPDEFDVITGDQVTYGSGSPATSRTAELLERIGYTLDAAKIRNLAGERGWDPLESDDIDEIRRYLAEQLTDDSLFQYVHEQLREEPEQLSDLAEKLFEDTPSDVREEATGNLLFLCTEAEIGDNQALLPTRLHMFLKGLPAQYACTNPKCSGRRVTEGENLLGRIYANPHTSCPECGSRVFELISHRTCGAAYLRAYRREGDSHGPTFLWTNPENTHDLEEMHLLVEKPRDDPLSGEKRPLSQTTKSQKLDLSSGYLVDSWSADEDNESDYIDVWVPSDDPPEDEYPRSWTQCPNCGIEESWWQGRTKIQDLVTKGEEPFANIVRSMFDIQPADPNKANLPNEGKKVLCFSDGRQKAARLARDLQGNVELDSFREVVADILSDTEDDLSMDRFFAEFAVYCHKNNISFFDDRDEYSTQEGTVYPGSRTRFQKIQNSLSEISERYGLDSIDEIPDESFARKEITDRPKQFDEILLKSLGDEYYSIPASLIGYLRPTNDVMDALTAMNDEIDENLLRSITIEALNHACEERAFDPEIDRYQRSSSLMYGFIRPDEEGVSFSNLVPEYVKETVSAELSNEQLESLGQSFIRTELFSPVREGNYAINPEATTIEIAVDDDWYRCQGCHQFSIVSLDDHCPREHCNGTLESVNDDDIHLQARKGFLRDPPRKVANGERDPFTLRSEEHSAQLSAKDESDAFSRSEVYELLFQDILVGDSDAEQPIDVLSCTTTMEVGIDIGSLTGVAMRTVPPGPENYEQRAGRAGRRGVGLSTIVTFADNSPHESHYFQHPEEMISADGSEPIIYSGNQKIAKRHINASLLARFFDPSEIEPGADVYQSLGTGEQFFAGDGTYSFPKFKDWINTVLSDDSSTVVSELAALLPSELGESKEKAWREEFIREAADEFLSDLENLQGTANWEETNNTESLLETLLNKALLPTFSFPTDVCDFVVKGTDENGQPKTKYEMSRDLKQALSTYVPGRDIVVDKKTYRSYGLHFKFPEHPVNRASGVDWDDLDWLNFCPRCETVFDQKDENMQEKGVECSVCEEEKLQSIQMYTPEAFAPKVDSRGSPEESENKDEERVYATPPKYPLTPTSRDVEFAEKLQGTKTFGPSTAGRLDNEQLLVANFGPDQEGFEVCTKCGAVGRDGDLGSSHNRPYPKDIRTVQEYDWDEKCSGSTVTTCFSHSFPSDLTVLRIPLEAPMQFVPDADWFESAAQSLSEALVMGSSRALGIESDELEGGFRTRSAELSDEDDVRGFIEIFLFDTTSGGAGFSLRVWEAFEEVLDETKNILSNCSCDSACHNCLRQYQNRHLHDALNRHQGLALYDYARNGTPPLVTDDQAQNLIEQLERSLQLQEPDTSINSVSGSPPRWEVSLNGEAVTFGVRSCLREKRVSDIDGLDADFSDHELSSYLPSVAYELIEKLE